MDCKRCKSTIVESISMPSDKSRYIRLYRRMFPKRPINLLYCQKCYADLISEMELEISSQTQHMKELESLCSNDKQKYSISDTTNDQIVNYSVIDKNCQEYHKICEHFHKTLSYEIIRIEKVYNKVLIEKFKHRSQQLSCQNIMYLFHGSNNVAYNSILETGFDLSYALASGLLGAGIYFAEDASYSHGYGRQTLTSIGKINHLLYCKVNLGRIGDGKTGLTKEPEGFDSVQGDGTHTYAVFDNFQGIPEYIIYYLVGGT